MSEEKDDILSTVAVAAQKNVTAKWFVMRVTYQREVALANMLREKGVLCYVPMGRVKKRNADGVAVGWKVEPLIHNYIFVFETYANLIALKHSHPKFDIMRFVMSIDTETKIREPQTVPFREMQSFIKVIESKLAVQLRPSVKYQKGDKVRVLTGLFEGVEGVIEKVSGNALRVVVQVAGIVTVATAVIEKKNIEKIETK